MNAKKFYKSIYLPDIKDKEALKFTYYDMIQFAEEYAKHKEK